ncbi:hypothetical protein HD554DRAFT_2087425 [Boletus coccyginus]|nr:hypothetical protein HD554DRAFT_2087425 [Boletus coccyginus]
MSTLNAPTAQQNDTSQDDGGGSGILNHALLFFEMLIMSLLVAGAIILAFHLAYPQSSVQLGRHFAFLAGAPALALFSSVVASVRRRKMSERGWCLLFHLPFFLSMSILGHMALQESSPTYGSLVLGIPFVHTILNIFYNNMTLAINKEDRAGPVFLDYLCQWITTLVSAICAVQQHCLGSAQSFKPAEHLGKVKIWFSDLVSTQHVVHMLPNEESAEESKTLLSHDDRIV